MACREIESLIAKGMSSSAIAGYARVLSDVHQLLHGHPIDYRGLVPSRSSDSPTEGRAYEADQVREIIANQPLPFAILTEIAHETGARPCELTNMRPSNEFPPVIQPERIKQYVEQRWLGRSGVFYTVTGKGGLERQILVPADLSHRLEAFRLDAPRMVQSIRGEDGRTFLQHYDLPTGERWSRNFSRTCVELFGRSNGPYGLRHGWVQARVLELQKLGLTWDQARLTVSQELGHFRMSETNTYLRG